MEDLSGQVLKSYELHEQIGAGGFGAVYRAYQPVVGRDVAVKVILPEYANRPDFIRRFEVEAQLVAHLEHPHIVPLYDYWREPNGAYLVMRWLPDNLSNSLKRGRWSPTEASGLLEQVAAALMNAHRRGVVHRDLKPDNILLDEDHNAYLADFGIATVLGNVSTGETTSTGTVFGSPSYISPEQIKDEPITPQADIYSLGVVMYEVLTGEKPFPDTLTLSALIYKHLNEPLPHLSELYPELVDVEDVLHKATAKQPSARYPDVAAFAEAFRRALPTNRGSVTGANPPLERATTNAVANPYKGLRAFEEADADDFFGREALVQHLLNSLDDDDLYRRFLAVVGPSGSGKSSVIRAGVLPALRSGAVSGSESWFYAEMFPGAHPLENLEAALLSVAAKPPTHLLEQLRADSRGLLWAIDTVLQGSDGDLLLFVDQFEEAFTLTEDETERTQFLDLLRVAVTDSTSRLRVIVTLRADFTDRPLQYVSLGELMGRRTRFVLPLAADEIERAISSPAERVGLYSDTDLLAAVVVDVRDEPGALPLLQYAMTELFERREGGHLTLTAYRESGGVLGSLARRAEEVFQELTPEQQGIARQVFLRLVTLGEGTEDTRRRVKRSELASIMCRPGVLQAVLDAFGKYRLLTFDRDKETREPTIEVAHEALIREWLHLREWLDTSRADVRLQRVLAVAVAEWIDAGRASGFLLTGGRLAQFEEWGATTNLGLTGDERAFIDDSVAARKQEEDAEAARVAHESALERRSRTVLRALVFVALLAALGGFGLSGIALSERSIAQTQLAIAEQQSAQLRFIALRSGVDTALEAQDTDQARAFAMEAEGQSGQAPAEVQPLLGRAAYAPGTVRLLNGHTMPVLDVEFSPYGKTALSSSFENSFILWDVATGQIIRRFEGHTDWVTSVAYSPDGKYVLSSSRDKTLILWDLQTGEIIRRFVGHNDWVDKVVFSPDGKTALSSGGNLYFAALNNPLLRSRDNDLILWDVATGQIIRRMSGHTQAVRGLAFSPDGIHAVSGSADNTEKVWNVQTGALERTFVGHNNLMLTEVITSDGNFVLSGAGDTNLLLWNLHTGEIVRTLLGNHSAIIDVAISPDGHTALSAAYDSTVILWNLDTGEPIRRLIGHREPVAAVAFSPNGRYALTGGGNLQGIITNTPSTDNTIRLWDLDNGAIVRRFAIHDTEVSQVAFSSDGKTILSASLGALIRSDIQTGVAVSRANVNNLSSSQGIANAMAFSPDERYVLAASGTSDLILWDMTTGQEVRRFAGLFRAAGSIDFSSDGRYAVTGSSDGMIVVWNVSTGEAVRRIQPGQSSITQIWSVAFSPNDQSLISGDIYGNLIQWDVNSGAMIRQFSAAHTTGVSTLFFSADGKKVLSGSADNTVILWDVASGTPIQRFVGHTSGVNSVALSPDQHFVLSGSSDNSVILWNADTGQAIYHFTEHTAPVTSVAFSADGRLALSGSNDHSVILWRIDPTLDSLVDWTRANRYLRPLNCDERQRYGLEQTDCPEATQAAETQTP